MSDASVASPIPNAPRRAEPPWELILLGLAVLTLALIPLKVHRAFGLPAHPLIIHVPVILVPLVGLAALALVARPAWMERWGIATGVFTVGALGGTILAVGAGQALRDDRGGGGGMGGGRIAEHAEAGENLRIVMVLFALALLATLWARRRNLLAGAPFVAARVVVAILAVLAIFFVIRTGHLGAQATWDMPSFGGGGGAPSGAGGGTGSPPAGFTPPGG
jgi:hypothetical protein